MQPVSSEPAESAPPVVGVLEGGPLITGSVEEGKKESCDGGGKEELGALTANTFGFHGEVVKNEKIPSQVRIINSYANLHEYVCVYVCM